MFLGFSVIDCIAQLSQICKNISQDLLNVLLAILLVYNGPAISFRFETFVDIEVLFKWKIKFKCTF